MTSIISSFMKAFQTVCGFVYFEGRQHLNLGTFTPCEAKGLFSHLSVVDDQLEEGVHEEDAVRQDAAAVQQHRL